MTRRFAAAIVLSAAALAGCNTSNAPAPTVTTAPLMDESVPPASRSACLAAVSRQTNNGDVQIIEMIFSEANSQVKVGVGPDRAPWRCLVSNDGVVQEVMSLTDEGAL
jgi:hypothetical protein